ncbi:MAG: signal peptidase II [Planctomycetota bacterium]|nr:signal peptidase II [Planctomycetota bacterium]
MASPFRSPASLSRFLFVAGAGLALDLWTKWLAFRTLAIAVVQANDGWFHVYGREPYRLIPGWLEFEVTTNQGAVFGQLQGQRILFLVMSVAATCFLFWLFSNSSNQRFYQILLGVLLAGVLGNLYDRLMLGYVRDMIHALPLWPHFFPWIFNVADSLLCIGVGLMVLYNFFHKPNAEHAK